MRTRSSRSLAPRLAERLPRSYRVSEMIQPQESHPLDHADRATLLRIAREAIAAHLAHRDPVTEEIPRSLSKPAGAFVTLTLGGELRGCIGTLDASQPLFRAVADSAVNAATRDPRFPPLSSRDFDRVKLEISVLGEFVPVSDPSRIVIGRDGLLIRASGRSGLLLPQVPVEQGWDLPTFLERLCVKAGLPAGSWRHSECRLESFTAEVFGEAPTG
ncbi:MAG: AmmeMemoRadiSam system protein A [Thermoanaerobaculia bacterium]